MSFNFLLIEETGMKNKKRIAYIKAEHIIIIHTWTLLPAVMVGAALKEKLTLQVWN